MWDKITDPFLNFNGAAIEVANAQVISFQTLLCMWSLIHAGIKVGKRPPVSLSTSSVHVTWSMHKREHV